MVIVPSSITCSRNPFKIATISRARYINASHVRHISIGPKRLWVHFVKVPSKIQANTRRDFHPRCASSTVTRLSVRSGCLSPSALRSSHDMNKAVCRKCVYTLHVPACTGQQAQQVACRFATSCSVDSLDRSSEQKHTHVEGYQLQCRAAPD